jgi:hypothetical protein
MTKSEAKKLHCTVEAAIAVIGGKYKAIIIWWLNEESRCVMNWLILIVAGLFEVVWAVALKMSNGFKNITADAVFAGEIVGLKLAR